LNVPIYPSERLVLFVTFGVYLLNEPVVVHVIVEDVVVFAIVLRVIALARERDIVISEEKVHCLNGRQVGLCDVLVSPKCCFFCLNLDFL